MEVQRFMIHCSRQMRSGSVHDAKLYMKRLYDFLCKNGYSTKDYKGLLAFRVSRETKLYPATSPDEVAAILSVIDAHPSRETGLRNHSAWLERFILHSYSGQILPHPPKAQAYSSHSS